LALLIYSGSTWVSRSQRIAQMEARITTLRARGPAGPVAAGTTPVATAAQLAAARRAARQLNLPWSELLNALEESTPAAIGILEIQPNSEDATLRIVAEAPSMPIMTGYLQGLQRSGPFRGVALERHELLSLGANGRAVRFSFRIAWGSALQGSP